jgi:hypothetical protein
MHAPAATAGPMDLRNTKKIKPFFTFSTFLPLQTVNPHRKRKNFRFLFCETLSLAIPWATFVPTH